MADAESGRRRLSPESVAHMAEAAGIAIAPERLPDVTAVLEELFALEGMLDDLDLTGVNPIVDDTEWPGHRQ